MEKFLYGKVMLVSWPDLLKVPVNLFNFLPWKYKMSQNEFLDLKEFFQTDQEMFDESKKELLKQIHLGVVKWEFETQLLSRQLMEDGYICYPAPGDDITNVFLSAKGLREIGL